MEMGKSTRDAKRAARNLGRLRTSSRSCPGTVRQLNARVELNCATCLARRWHRACFVPGSMKRTRTKRARALTAEQLQLARGGTSILILQPDAFAKADQPKQSLYYPEEM